MYCWHVGSEHFWKRKNCWKYTYLHIFNSNPLALCSFGISSYLYATRNSSSSWAASKRKADLSFRQIRPRWHHCFPYSEKCRPQKLDVSANVCLENSKTYLKQQYFFKKLADQKIKTNFDRERKKYKNNKNSCM